MNFQAWLGEADKDIQEVVAAEQLKGKSVSEILKELVRRGMNKRDDRIEKLLEQQMERIDRMLNIIEEKQK